MKWKNRLTNYNFWISIVSAVLLIFQAFKFEFDIAYINEIATAVLGLLVVIGIISDPTRTYSSAQDINKAVDMQTQSPAVEEKSVDKVEESKMEEPIKSLETLQMPTEVADSYGDVENDFQVLINKISADINENLEKINQIQNSILSEINLKQEPKPEPAKEIQETTVETPVCFNIVN